MLLSIDGTFLVQMLNFVLFWVLLNYVFIAPTRRAIEERQRQIAEQYREADAMAKRAAALEAERDALLDTARRQTDEIMREAASRAAAQTHEIERKAAEEAAAEVQVAHAAVASELAAAVSSQGRVVSDLARSMVVKAVGTEGAA